MRTSPTVSLTSTPSSQNDPPPLGGMDMGSDTAPVRFSVPHGTTLPPSSSRSVAVAPAADSGGWKVADTPPSQPPRITTGVAESVTHASGFDSFIA